MSKYYLKAIKQNKEEISMLLKSLSSEKMISELNLYDIDAFILSFESMSDLLIKLTNSNIITPDVINFKIYDDKGYTYNLIFNNDLLKKCSHSVESVPNRGLVIGNNISDFPEYANSFLDFISSGDGKIFLDEFYKINSNFKNKLSNYSYLSKNCFSEEELNQLLLLKSEILKELRRYKTFRGIVISRNQYENYLKNNKGPINYKYKPVIHENKKEIEVKSIDEHIKEYEKQKYDETHMTETEIYNRENEEFLDDNEFEDAYGSPLKL